MDEEEEGAQYAYAYSDRELQQLLHEADAGIQGVRRFLAYCAGHELSPDKSLALPAMLHPGQPAWLRAPGAAVLFRSRASLRRSRPNCCASLRQQHEMYPGVLSTSAS